MRVQWTRSFAALFRSLLTRGRLAGFVAFQHIGALRIVI
jgi:hypothetical protein